jgi:hypothetical protein
MKRWLLSLAALTTLGCGSSEDERAFTDCGSIGGSFQATERVESGTCPVYGDPFSINVTANADQTADVEFVEFDITCGAAVNGCSLKGNCPIRSGMPEMITGNVSLDFTLETTGIRGSYTVTLNPGSAASPNGCTGRFAVNGTRR